MSNFPAVLAAVQARGPRCDDCGNWTFRPELSGSHWWQLCAECEASDQKIPAPEGWIE